MMRRLVAWILCNVAGRHEPVSFYRAQFNPCETLHLGVHCARCHRYLWQTYKAGIVYYTPGRPA